MKCLTQCLSASAVPGVAALKVASAILDSRFGQSASLGGGGDAGGKSSKRQKPYTVKVSVGFDSQILHLMDAFCPSLKV